MAAVNNLKGFIIGGRTDNAGAATVSDVDQEELRLLPMSLLRQGLLANALDGTPNPNGFRVRQDTGLNMNVKIGSTQLSRDLYMLRGNSVGQGGYLIRNDGASGVITKTAPATDGALPCRYGVFLFVDDVAYTGDAGRAYFDITVLRGTPNASPTTPAASAVWSAWALLWEFQLPALATAVTDVILDSATSFDRRVSADLLPQNFLEQQVWS